MTPVSKIDNTLGEWEAFLKCAEAALEAEDWSKLQRVLRSGRVPFTQLQLLLTAHGGRPDPSVSVEQQQRIDRCGIRLQRLIDGVSDWQKRLGTRISRRGRARATTRAYQQAGPVRPRHVRLQARGKSNRPGTDNQTKREA